jgi:hypothetical protein
VTVPFIRTPLPFECDDCKKPLGKGTVISPHDGRVFCDSICAARDYVRSKLGDEPTATIAEPTPVTRSPLDIIRPPNRTSGERFFLIATARSSAVTRSSRSYNASPSP